MADFSKKQGDVQGVGPTTAAPRTSGEPKATTTEAPEGPNRAEFGPGPGIRGNTKKIS